MGAVPAPEQACAALQGRNRRCITLDLHREEGRDILRRLSDRADVLIENFRPGVMEKWGLGPNVSPPHLCRKPVQRSLSRVAMAATALCFSTDGILPSTYIAVEAQAAAVTHQYQDADSTSVKNQDCRHTSVIKQEHPCRIVQDLKDTLIYTRISGYGQTGPKAQLAGYASVCEAYGGIRCGTLHCIAPLCC